MTAWAEAVTGSSRSVAPGRVQAVLGPTNTGKTHLAIERLTAYRSGMIGFPLRLLARENYERVASILGHGRVALITGEEKIRPERASHFICTVESMPLDIAVDFLAIDEIQLCADPERGHIFTHRLLHARGEQETMVLGAETVRPLLQQLLPQVSFHSRPRMSDLYHTGAAKLSRLPRRSAVVAFSANDVYQHAELIRRTRGGTAVVLGALSPRTRNAQVEMYQAGEVDYLVATDAIGMGLNMDIDHVAFARLVKFDGRRARHLTPHEIGQIAGRAGRHVTDGTFGTTAEAGSLSAETVAQVEGHSFPPLKALMWRNHALDFRSVGFLLKSLETAPPLDSLSRARDATDHNALAILADDAEVMARAKGRDAVALLWDVCQVPDFRKTVPDAHVRLLKRLFLQLRAAGGDGPGLDEAWVARQIRALDDTTGDIDQLGQRIAAIRTWTYIAHRGDWLPNARTWQEYSRAVEDRLSDALHERLTQRFVDRRASALMKSLDGGAPLMAGVKRDGAVLVEGEHVGRLDGFRFRLASSVEGAHSKPIKAAAHRALGDEITQRVQRLEQAGDETFSLADEGAIAWDCEPVARLQPGADMLNPEVSLLDTELLAGHERARVARRLQRWLTTRIQERLPALSALRTAELSGAARGLAYQLAENLGVLARQDIAGGDAEGVMAALTKADRWSLQRLGVVLGQHHIFVPALLKPGAAEMKALLWAVHTGAGLPARIVPDGRVAQPAAEGPAPELAQILGFQPVKLADGSYRLVRVDMLDRLDRQARQARDQGVVMPDARWSDLIGGGGLPAVFAALAALGWKRERLADGTPVLRLRGGAKKRRGRQRNPGGGGRGRRASPDSPFAVLEELTTPS